jgi:putative methionine-R-sulfoxide reductase with GAF domain
MTDDVINQPIEILMQPHEIDADAAQSLRSRLSTHYQQPVTDVARGPISTSSVPATGGPSRAGRRQAEAVVDGFSRNHNIHMRIAALIRDLYARAPAEVATALDELTAAAAHHVPGAQYAGITAIDRRGRIDTLSATGRYPGLVDVIQRRHQQGPCLEAVREDHIVRVDDLSNDTRWPHYRRDALAETPIRSVLSFAMSAGQDPLGALSLYSEQPYAFEAESEDLGFVWAAHAALAWSALRRDMQFRSALASRDIIGQAKGMLMERYRIDADRAFDRLRQLSQESNIPVAEISRRLVEAGRPRKNVTTPVASKRAAPTAVVAFRA